MRPGDATGLLLAALAAAVLLAGCATPGVVPPRDAAGRYVVRMESSLVFAPAEVRVPVGATVVWVNNGTVAHDVSGYEGDPPRADRPEFFAADGQGLTRFLAPGESYEHTFTRAGTWTVWCHTHHEERMKGRVHVG
jgi:plastocyanin